MNRRIRNRTYGGVGGRREQSRLLPDANRDRVVIETALNAVHVRTRRKRSHFDHTAGIIVLSVEHVRAGKLLLLLLHGLQLMLVMVSSVTAKPCTPVRFRLQPPLNQAFRCTPLG